MNPDFMPTTHYGYDVGGCGGCNNLRIRNANLQKTIEAHVTLVRNVRKDKDELLDTTLCNLSNARGELSKLRGTDEHTAHKMKQRIVELECLVIQAAVDKQVDRPDTKDETTRDIAISCNKYQAIQTGIRFMVPVMALIVIDFVSLAKQVLTMYLAQ